MKIVKGQKSDIEITIHSTQADSVFIRKYQAQLSIVSHYKLLLWHDGPNIQSGSCVFSER